MIHYQKGVICDRRTKGKTAENWLNESLQSYEKP